MEKEIVLPKDKTSYKLKNDKEITIRPQDDVFGIPFHDPLVPSEWYVWWRKGIPLIIAKEDKFLPQNRFAFSPLPYDVMSVEGVAFALIMLKLSKTPEGQKILERLAMKYMDSIASIVESVQGPAKTHWAVGLNAQTTTAAILHRTGLIDDGGYEKIVDQSRTVFDKIWTKDFVEKMASNLTTLVEGSKVSAEGGTGLGALAAILAPLLKTAAATA